MYRKIYIILALALVAGSVLALDTAKQVRKAELSKSKTPDQAEVKLLERHDGELVFEWQCPEVVISRDPTNSEVTALNMAGAEPIYEVGVPQLPILTQFLDCLPGKVTATVIESDVETRVLGAMAPTPEDMPVDLHPSDDPDGDRLDESPPRLSWEERRAQTPLKTGPFPETPLMVKEAGVYRGHRIMAVQLFPVQVNAVNGTARIIKRARIRVTLPASANQDARLPDSPHETELVRGMLGALGSTALPSRMTEAFVGRGAEDAPLDDPQPIGGRWKLIVNQEGIVRVRHEALVLAGVPVDAITTFDTHIYNRGHEVPIYFEGEGDGHFDMQDHIDFYGIPNRQTFQQQNPVMYNDPWTDDNVYWLSWGDGIPGMRLGVQSLTWHPTWATDTSIVRHVKAVTSLRTKLHIERDLKHDRLAASASNYASEFELLGPLGVHEDHWFYGPFISGLSTREFSISIPYPNTNSFRTVKVRAAFQGSTYEFPYNPFNPYSGPNSGYHRASVYLNGLTAPGLTVGKVSHNDNNFPWRNQTPIIIESTSDSVGITTDQLVDGPNTISVSLPGDGISGANDKIYVNWFEIEYDRAMRASKGAVGFDLSSIMRIDTTIGDTLSIDLRGFAGRNVSLWDLDRGRIADYDVRLVAPQDESPSWAIRFHLIVDRDYHFYAFDDRPPFAPAAILPEVSTADLRNQAGAEYLMIYHDSFNLDNLALAALARLDSLRQASFFGSTMMVPLSAVYEQFNGGIVSPYGIRDFVKYAYDHWEIRPTHVCLVGDGVLDTKGYRGSGNMIPSFYPQTGGKAIGICAADMFFGTVSGPPWDLLPDVAVGRISARTGAELQTYVDKVLHYETTSDYTTLFHGNLLFVADHKDPQFDFAGGFSEPVVQTVNNDIIVSRVYLDSLAPGQGPSTLRDAFRNGAVIVNYNGHGGGGVWSNSNLLDVGGIRQLRNRRGFPFVTNFTCFVGAFDDRDQTAVLGEAFLFSRNNDGDLVGGIGVYSSSGVGWAANGVAMQRVLFDFVSRPPAKTLGEIVLLNKAHFWANATSFTPRFSFLQLEIPYSQLVMMNLLGDPGVRLTLPEGPLASVSTDTAIVSQGDTILVSGTLPWVPGVSPTDVYILPYNADRYDTVRFYDLQNDTSYVIPAFVSSRVPAFLPNDVNSLPATAQQFTFPLGIGPRFNTPLGRIIVYAVDRTLRRDALSAVPIFFADSLTIARVYDVDVLPAGFILNDSTFRVQARIMHRSGIEQARMRGAFRPAQGPIVLDTVDLQQIEPGLWRSDWLGPYTTVGGSYRATFYVKPYDTDWQSTAPQTLDLEQYTDFYPDTARGLTPRVVGLGRPYFYLPVAHRRYGRNRPIPEIEMQLTGVSDSTIIGGVMAVDSFATSIFWPIPDQASSLNEVLIPVVLHPVRYRFKATIDPNNQIVETSEINNTFQVTVNQPRVYSASNSFGSFYLRPLEQNTFHRQWAAGLDTLWVRIAPGSLPLDTAAVVFSGPDTLTSAELATLQPQGLYQVTFGRVTRVFRAQFGDSSEAIAPGGQIEVLMNISHVTASTLSELAIFEKRSLSPSWWRLDNTRFDTLAIALDTTTFIYYYTGRLSGFAHALGDFVIFRSRDETGPVVNIAVDGMTFTAGSILPRRPLIYANVSDLNGIDRSPSRFAMILDNDTIPASEVSWSDTLQSGGNMSALFRPQLDAGHHTLRVYATDNAGNSSETTVEFEVRGDFGIEWAINYPNPFSRVTKISYLLTDVTDDYVEIKIFTVSGRKIASLRETDPTVMNYRTIDWDGTDDTGEEVANGVYFARLTAKQGDRKVEKTIKMAKVR